MKNLIHFLLFNGIAALQEYEFLQVGQNSGVYQLKKMDQNDMNKINFEQLFDTQPQQSIVQKKTDQNLMQKAKGPDADDESVVDGAIAQVVKSKKAKKIESKKAAQDDELDAAESEGNKELADEVSKPEKPSKKTKITKEDKPLNKIAKALKQTEESDDEEMDEHHHDHELKDFKLSKKKKGKKVYRGNGQRREGEILSRLNNAGRMLWSTDHIGNQDRTRRSKQISRERHHDGDNWFDDELEAKNIKRSPRLRSRKLTKQKSKDLDSQTDEEAEDSESLHWRKNWHPNVKHYIHGGRHGHNDHDCKHRTRADSEDQAVHSNEEETDFDHSEKKISRRKRERDSDQSEQSGTDSEDENSQAAKRDRKKNKDGASDSSDDTDSDEEEDEKRPQSVAQRLRKINRTAKEIQNNLEDVLKP